MYKTCLYKSYTNKSIQEKTSSPSAPNPTTAFISCGVVLVLQWQLLLLLRWCFSPCAVMLDVRGPPFVTVQGKHMWCTAMGMPQCQEDREVQEAGRSSTASMNCSIPV